jgi:deferrochelatase/peroxidase EfeB
MLTATGNAPPDSLLRKEQIMDEATSKIFDGITDLIVVAPIKPGFIAAFETISHEGRLKLVAEALNRLRVTAREHERLAPFSDVTERILSLLDFRIGIIDKDLFALAAPDRAATAADAKPDSGRLELQPRRYLYLTATFEGGFEPYMRQIWRPLGPFLDLLFCNCENYVTASEHSFDEYIQWVRDNQVESAIFYSTTGLTLRDHLYLSRLEAAQRRGAPDLELASLTMPYPDEEAARTRAAHIRKTVELGYEALNVLFKLADYYPPEWLTGTRPGMGREGHRLIRATREILRGWREFLAGLQKLIAANPNNPIMKKLDATLKAARSIYAEPINWDETGVARVPDLNVPSPPAVPPQIEVTDVQAGIIKPHGQRETPVRHGALLLFTVRDARQARRFIVDRVKSGVISFEGGRRDAAVFANIAFTRAGLQHLAMNRDTLERFPREFRDGMAQRSGILGDMREHHPRNWMLPERNGPAFTDPGTFAGKALPPVDLNEVDIVIQLRGTETTDAALRAAALALATPNDSGITLEAIEWLNVNEDGEGRFVDHFGYIDGISQPRPQYQGGQQKLPRDAVALGEVLHGHANDRQDGPPAVFDTLDANRPGPQPDTHWRQRPHQAALNFQKNGSYLVLRKIGMESVQFDQWLDENAQAVADELNLGKAAARALLKAKVMGREHDGAPLVTTPPTDPNDFDFGGDLAGSQCPHAAHIRRANPRKASMDPASPVETRAEFNRPTPRLVRRGMMFGQRGTPGSGLMFMAYAASIAEQYEVIQRWLNGGNPTDVASANNDILTGVRPRQGGGTFRFVAQWIDPQSGTSSDVVVRVPLPPVTQKSGDFAGEPGRHPFTPLYWGLYLFAPSRAALLSMAKWRGIYIPIEEMREDAIGNPVIQRLQALPADEAGKEWKRIIEDFITRDPAQRNISPHVWSTIRWRLGGAYNLDGAMPFIGGSSDAAAGRRHNWFNPDWSKQNIIICAGHRQVMQVLAQWQFFTSEDQLRRIKPNAGPIYVTQQPDDKYMRSDLPGKKNPLNYHDESAATNGALLAYQQTPAFLDGYQAGRAVLDAIKARAAEGPDGKFVKIELKREYFQPAIAELWKRWYGLPDDKEEALHAGGWSWKQLVETVIDAETERDAALCPGDFMAPSRGAVFPRPGEAVRSFAAMHGTAILQAGRAFVAKYRGKEPTLKTDLIRKVFAACDNTPAGNEVLARNIIGTMIGAIPPMDANLRNIMLEWLLENSLWRHQAAMQRAMAGKTVPEQAEAVQQALRVGISQAICKRPAPDILYRTAKGTSTIALSERPKDVFDLDDVTTREGDLVAVSLVSASQWSLVSDTQDGAGDVSVVFGGNRSSAYQGYTVANGGAVSPDPAASNDEPVHACPAQKMAMGGMTGIIAALLDAGTIQALPASLIIKISGWPGSAPPPGTTASPSP